MVKIIINNKNCVECNAQNYSQATQDIEKVTFLTTSEYYLTFEGRILIDDNHDAFNETSIIRCCLRLNGGKGGFGSMLRAIGAQIEKTTNREACRDLSGRRLRDINEEKRLKAWLEKQSEREREAEERKKRKIEKLLAVPKHDFKDEDYEEARSKLTEKVNDAVEEGFKKAEQSKKIATDEKSETTNTKRKAETSTSTKLNSKKTALWIGDDISDASTDSDSDDEPGPSTSKKLKNN